MSLGVDLGTNVPYLESRKNLENAHRDYYKNPKKYYMEPFRIFGNLYYIGDKKVCSHLIDTGEGLIALDSGYSHAAYLYERSIRTLGFDPADVKMIIHSHGHFDHFGASPKMKDLYGCKLLLSRADHERLQLDPRAALMESAPDPYGPLLEADQLIDDGDIISLGNTNIRCVSAPGHTEGTMAFFFNATDGDVTYSVGCIGGVGFNSLYKEFLLEYGLPLDMQERMASTICKMRKEWADISLGNHPNQNGTVEKRQYMMEHPGENPFIDPLVWTEVLDALDTRLRSFRTLGY